jgi:hypothetical protein
MRKIKNRWQDYIGKKRGMLTIIDRDRSVLKGNTKFICKCDCGKIVSVSSAIIWGERSGRMAESCGCNYLNPQSGWWKLIGQKINKWTVIGKAPEGISHHIRMKCQCDCGFIGTVDKHSLMSGKSKSCGCSDKSDITGKILYGFEVLRQCGINKRNNLLWEVKCVICTKISIRAKTGDRRFTVCGCKTKRLPKEETAIKALYKGYIRQAKNRQITFDINIDDFKHSKNGL